VTRLRVFVARIRALVRSRQVDQDFRAEITSHIHEATEQYICQGYSPEEARLAARRSFGGVLHIEDAHRDARSFVWLDLLLHEFRHAGRTLRRSPGFAAVAVLTLAVAVGAVTALFTVVDDVVLRPLDYPDADRIVSIVNRYVDRRAPLLTGGDETDIAAMPDAFAAIAYYSGGEMGVQLGDHAEFTGVRRVHPDFFRVFQLAPVAGRLLTRDDAQRSALVSLGFAERNYGSPAAALGRSVFIENRAYDVVGVMPAGMQFPASTDVWTAGPLEPPNRNRSGHNFRAVARLAPGVSVESADARLSALAEKLAVAFPVTNQGKTFAAILLRDTLVADVQTTLWVLLGAVGLLLLIACANVANLMLARGETRVREIAVRAALGASRHRLVGQMLVESLLVGIASSGLGLVFAYVGTHVLLSIGTSYVPLPRLQDVHVDVRVLGFSLVMSLFTTVACGLAPAVRVSSIRVTDALNHAGARSALGGRSAGMRSALVLAQIALSCVLAVDAALLLRSFVRLTETPLGFNHDNVLVTYAHAPARGSFFDHSGLDNYLRAGQFFDDLLDHVRRLPNVMTAGAAMGLPTGQYDSNGSYAIEGKQTLSGDFRRLPSAGFRLASPHYFETLGIPVLRGREFNNGDTYNRPSAVIVSQALAREQFGTENPLGHRIMCGLDRVDEWMTIVGVVGDVRQASPVSAPGPELYMPLRQHPYTANEVQIVIRTRTRPESFIGTMREVVHSMNPGVATKFLTLDASIDNSITAPRFRATLLSTFAALALFLALSGIYAVMSYTTAQRTAEFGLRVAMGARSTDVVRLVLASAGRLTIAGLVIGLLLAFATSRLIASMLFGVTATDLGTYAGILTLGMPFAALAAAIPAWRAAHADPLVALRSE